VRAEQADAREARFGNGRGRRIGDVQQRIATARAIAGATLCIVFVQMTRKSAPAASRDRAASARASPACTQSPASCSRSMS
jgi:hypothetical protein